MQEIIYRQRNAAKPMTGKRFVLSIAGIIMRLAIMQMVINLLISLTGIGLLNVAFYLYAVWLLIAFMRSTVAAYVYTLKPDTLVLERKLGDSTITVVEIPLEHVISLREMRMGENLHISYRDVMHIDPDSRPPFRVRAAFMASLLSSHLAKLLAGKRTQEVIGHVIVYDAGNLCCARTFCPDEALLALLEERLGESFGFDERMTRAQIRTLYSRALERAFPALYPYVDPLIKPEDVQWANEEIARQKAERKKKKNPEMAQKAREESEEETETESQEESAEESQKEAVEEAKEETEEETVQADAQQDAPRRRRKQG